DPNVRQPPARLCGAADPVRSRADHRHRDLGDDGRHPPLQCLRQAVRHTGLDVTVYSSDGKRAPGHLAKQGPPLLRWALYEAACLAAHTRAGDHDFYATVKDRIDHKRAAISVA